MHEASIERRGEKEGFMFFVIWLLIAAALVLGVVLVATGVLRLGDVVYWNVGIVFACCALIAADTFLDL